MSKLFAYLSYRNLEAAIEWLAALGFETTTRQESDRGVVHAELRLGDAVVMVAPADEPSAPTSPVAHGEGSEAVHLGGQANCPACGTRHTAIGSRRPANPHPSPRPPASCAATSSWWAAATPAS